MHDLQTRRAECGAGLLDVATRFRQHRLLERAEEAADPLRRAYELDRSDMTAVCNFAGCLADNARTEEACNVLAEGR